MVTNTLLKASKTTAIDTADFTVHGETVSLTPDTIRKYLVSGGGAVTDQEIIMFLNRCKYQHLNPFLGEAYLIKYGNNPATIVVGKDVFVRRARKEPDFDGFEAGIVVKDKDGNVIERQGSAYYQGETLLGGWARVFIKGMRIPYYASVMFSEYAGRTKEGKLNSQWASRPATMIRKVALSQALREAFPEQISGMYEPEEIAEATQQELPETPVIPAEEKKPAPVPKEMPKMQEESEDDIAAALFG